MASLASQAVVGSAEEFILRIRSAMIRHAQYRVGQIDDSAGLASLGKQILNNPDNFSPLFAMVIATEPGLQDNLDLNPTTGASITDDQILSAVEVVFPSFVR